MGQHRRWFPQDQDGAEKVVLPIIDMYATGQNIVRLRESAGLSVNDLQEKLKLATSQAIYRWQRGETIPSIDNLIVLADIFGVTVDEIIVRRYIEY